MSTTPGMPLPNGLYAITPDAPQTPTTEALCAMVRQAIEGGARVIQYRDKTSGSEARLERARALLSLCRDACVPLIINDDLDLAYRIRADGVHLGRDDDDPVRAREQLGPDAIIGVSCYDDLERARRAARQGASYVAFGSFFPSPTKPHATPAPAGLLTRARETLALPLVAIGGITPQNGASLITAGAHMLAVITGVFSASDITAAARAYTLLFPQETD